MLIGLLGRLPGVNEADIRVGPLSIIEGPVHKKKFGRQERRATLRCPRHFVVNIGLY
jgi:hypothetical protein